MNKELSLCAGRLAHTVWHRESELWVRSEPKPRCSQVGQPRVSLVSSPSFSFSCKMELLIQILIAILEMLYTICDKNALS